jgi:hypothetical protein
MNMLERFRADAKRALADIRARGADKESIDRVRHAYRKAEKEFERINCGSWRS